MGFESLFPDLTRGGDPPVPVYAAGVAPGPHHTRASHGQIAQTVERSPEKRQAEGSTTSLTTMSMTAVGTREDRAGPVRLAAGVTSPAVSRASRRAGSHAHPARGAIGFGHSCVSGVLAGLADESQLAGYQPSKLVVAGSTPVVRSLFDLRR